MQFSYAKLFAYQRLCKDSYVGGVAKRKPIPIRMSFVRLNQAFNQLTSERPAPFWVFEPHLIRGRHFAMI